MMILQKENNKKLVLTGLLIGLIFAELDETVVSTAMPTIIRELHGLSLYGWVAGIYMLAVTMFMPILGKLADLYGRKRVYLSCMALFIVGSIVSGMASSMTMLLVGRGIQGIGAGGLMPLALVIIGDTYPLEQRAKIQSLFGPMMILPQLLGPTVGGYLVGHVNWHWVFLINIPIGIIAASVLSIGMRESRSSEKRKIDWIGALTLILALLSLLLAPVLIDNNGLSWSSPIIIGMLVLSALFTALFVWIESKVQEPIIPLHLFRNRNVVVLSILVLILMLGLMGGIATFPFFAQNVMGLTPTAAGYLTLAFMAGAIPSSILNGFLITRVPYRNLFIICFILPVIGFILLTQIGIGTTVLYIVVTFFILGLGIGALFGGDNLIVQESVDKEHSGVALGTVQLFQALGATIGLSIFGSLLARQIKSGVADLADQLPAGKAENIATGGIPSGLAPDLLVKIQTVFAEAFQNIFVISLFFVIAAFFVTWFLKKEVLTKKAEPDQAAASLH
ncbi:MFS transporter [Paenibacillus baekrokdamisoli]|uniref:MFS transporter n=1 Tax=Paenibacillus baekrokdamisoli TaxID=1712516 RepID=A0A3G9J1Z7_9BACL|nr:MDR family MFS transporter [Paenibacillus baekrokdamisoli]MBB3071383.1 EmrB/QacA subfamily drug resistance transporter [Paenibacillus baekrokdamisoli]BBH24582.1 MFS transporter [Paenibacillus baekrokdamisoli]